MYYLHVYKGMSDWDQDFDQFTLTLDHTIKLKALDDLTSH